MGNQPSTPGIIIYLFLHSIFLFLCFEIICLVDVFMFESQQIMIFNELCETFQWIANCCWIFFFFFLIVVDASEAEKRNERRAKIAREIFETEASYVASLMIVAEVFFFFFFKVKFIHQSINQNDSFILCL